MRLITSWYQLGAYGAWGGPLHFVSEIGVHNEPEHTVEWWVDMGNAGSEAIDVLAKALEGFSDAEQVALEKLVLGWRQAE